MPTSRDSHDALCKLRLMAQILRERAADNEPLNADEMVSLADLISAACTDLKPALRVVS